MFTMCQPFGASRSSPHLCPRSRFHEACEHAVAKGRNREILEQIGRVAPELIVFTTAAICLPENLPFLCGLPDGTRGGDWARAVGGYMLDGRTAKGGIEVGGL